MGKYYIIIISIWCGAFADETNSYSGAKVYEVIPKNEQHLLMLQDLNSRLEKRDLTAEDAEKISFWKDPHSVGVPVHFLVQERHDREVTGMLRDAGIQQTIMIQDVGQVIQDQKDRSDVRKRDTKDGFYNDYQRYDDIMGRIDELVRAHSTLMTKTVIGHSHEGRNLVVLELKSRNKRFSGPKKSIWIDGGIHAREWISPATTMYILESLVENPEMLDNTDFYVMPLMNPDGYEYSHTTNRMWRKNRSLNSGHKCKGVDLNRNFNFKWLVVGASSNPCLETYAGPEALSEPEARFTANYLQTELPDLDVYLTLHSYGQEWMGPWGYTFDKVEKDEGQRLAEMGNAAVEAIRSETGTKYVYGTAARLTGLASGASDDWSYERVKGRGKYSYTVELRDQYPTGRYGFLLPKEEIIPTGKEMWKAVQCVNLKVHGSDCMK